MKKLYFLVILCAISTFAYTQPVNYTVTVTQVQWFEGGIFGSCQEFGTEEYSALVWFDDNLDGTDVGGNCFQCNNNGNCTITPNTTLGGRNNTCAETINIVFEAWENDSNPRCTENGGDDCECGPATVASIPFQNNGPGCSTYGTFGCSGNHNVQVQICWDYVTPPPPNDDCPGAIAVGAGTTPFTLLEECSGPDITSCSANDYNDIWYEYTVGNCHLEQLVVDTEGSGFDTALSIFDACGGNEIDCDDDGGSGLLSNITIDGCIDPGTTYYIRVSGWNGADGTGTLNITETLDTTAPTFVNCPTQADLPVGANCMAAIPDFTTTATASDNCDNSITITQSPAAGTMVGLGAQSVTLTATDDCTNTTSTCVVNFNVVDGTAPVCVPQNITVNLDASGNASVTAAQIDGGSTDNCGSISTTISAGQTTYTCDDAGSSFTVTLQVMDAAGNTSTCDATVTVADPLVACCVTTAVCQDVTIQLDANGEATISTGTTTTTLANSSAEFSGVQGQDDWFYGTYPGNVPANYTNLPNYTGFVWNNPGVGAILDFPQIDPNGGHPQFEGPQPAVRRWVSNYCGEITIAGDFFDRDTNCGDGAHVRIFVNGVQVYDFLNIPGNSVPYNITQMVNPGDQVDFVIDPIFDAACDDTHFTAVITAEVEDFIINNGSSSTCGIACIEVSQEDFTCDDLGANTVTMTVTDVNGDTQTCTAEVTVEDNISPTASNPANVSVQCPADVPTGDPAIITDEMDNCTPTVTFVGQTSDGMTCPETITHTYSVTDESGNSINVTQTITVNDDTAPTAVCQDITVNLDATGNATITTADIDNGSNDNCTTAADLILSLDRTTFNCDDLGGAGVPVVLTVEDECGNTATCTAMVTVTDPLSSCCAMPTAVCQAFTAQLDATGNVTIAAADVDGGSTAECGLQSLVIDNDAFTCADLGTNNVTLTITDINGDSDQCTAVVTVEDNTPPTASDPADVNIQCPLDVPATDPAVVTDEADNCSATVAFVSEMSDQNTCPETITRTYSVTDPSGNSINVTQTIIVNDDTPPIPVCQDITVTLDAAGQASITAADVENGSTDNCTATVDLNFTLSQTTFDCTNAGQVVPITMTVTDECGNSADCTANVTVNDDSAPSVATCPANISVNNDAGVCEAVVDYDLPTFGDNCDGTNTGTLVAGLAPGSVFPIGVTTVTYEYTDAAGNMMATCSFEVEVIDNEAPNAVCQNLTLGLDENFELMITPEDIDAGSTDNCGVSDLILDMENFDCTNSGTNMVTLTVVDDAGNSSVCTAQVEIPTTPEPMITCPVNLRDCDGQFDLECTDLNPFTFGISQATISGTAAPYVTGDISPGGNATLNLATAPSGVPLTLTYTLTVGNCPPVSFTCTFMVTSTNTSNAGSLNGN